MGYLEEWRRNNVLILAGSAFLISLLIVCLGLGQQTSFVPQTTNLSLANNEQQSYGAWGSDATWHTTNELTTWNFDKDLEGWKRIGTVPPWDNFDSILKWNEYWGGAFGVITMNGCEQKASSFSSSCGINKDVTLHTDARFLELDLVKASYDGGFRVFILDSNGRHLLGEGILYGGDKKQLSYDISQWAGKYVTIEIRGIGAGKSGMDNPPKGTLCEPTCCFEEIGVDRIAIARSKDIYNTPLQAAVNVTTTQAPSDGSESGRKMPPPPPHKT